MKKIFMLSILAMIAMFNRQNVCAAASSTGWLHGPSLVAGGGYVATEVYRLTTPAQTSVTYSATSVYFDRTRDLPDSFEVNNLRYLKAVLMEDDVSPNADDQIKTYTCHFEERRLTNCDVEVHGSGNIDSAGDKTVELYLKFLLPYVYGDPSYGTGSFFDYIVSVR